MISIIVPVYNVEPYLDRCVASLVAQTYRDIEIILVDDGSPDHCPAMCDAWAKKDPRIRVLHKPNGGLSDARNAGLAAAHGEWIQFVDSDDLVDPAYSETLLRAAEENDAQIAVCNCLIAHETEDGTLTSEPAPSSIDEPQHIFTGRELIDYFIRERGGTDLCVTWTKLFHRSIFDSPRQTRFPKGMLHEDNFTTYKFYYEAARVVVLNQPLYTYVQRTGSIMGAYGPRNIASLLALVRDDLTWYQTNAPELRNILQYAGLHRYFAIVKACIQQHACHVCLPDVTASWQDVKQLLGDVSVNPYMTRRMRKKMWMADRGILHKVERVQNISPARDVQKALAKLRQKSIRYYRIKYTLRFLRCISPWWNRIHSGGRPKSYKELLWNMDCYQYLKYEARHVLARADVGAVSKKKARVKKIWWCWLQGLDQAPALPRACLHSLHVLFPEYEICIVTEKNLKAYVEIPADIMDKWHRGVISAAHFSDLVRIFLLAEHGGVWIDATVFATSHAPAETGGVFDAPLFFYSSYMQEDASMAGSSWLISAVPGHPVICLTRDLLLWYWKNHDYLIHYFLFHLFFHMALEQYSDEWKRVPTYSNIPPHIMQKELFAPLDQRRFRQMATMSSFHKLTHHRNEATEGNLGGTLYDEIVHHTDRALAEAGAIQR